MGKGNNGFGCLYNIGSLAEKRKKRKTESEKEKKRGNPEIREASLTGLFTYPLISFFKFGLIFLC